ncbi:MAG: efflux RND transporter permease subunit [Deltaproteobacteria bacterium]|nr:MAG: efflux RND transporter permease subunit [Deltaproteobacteria bacterium]
MSEPTPQGRDEAASGSGLPDLGGLFLHVVTHPVAVSMIFLAALVFGYVSYKRLAIELMPDIGYPTITVRTTYEGAAPGEVENQVSRPLEEALATLDGLVTLESRSRAGSSDVVLGFGWDTDMSAAVQTVRENLQTTFLPDGVDRPLILRYDPSLDPFLRIAVAVDDPDANPETALVGLREIAEDDIKRRLESTEGVAAVRVRGGLEREIRIEVREDWLGARKLQLSEVQSALSSQNINLAGGSILEGDTEYLVRTLNEYRDLDELKALAIRRSDGVTIRLDEVARVTEGHREREVVSLLDGSEAVELEVFKEADANVVSVAAEVMTALNGTPSVGFGLPGDPGIIGELPDGVHLAVLDNQAEFIEAAIDNLFSTALLGGVLAIVILFLFLKDFRSTRIIGIAIPMSVVIGFAPLYLTGVTLNLMSLGGLALGVGMLVDNAVVVLESIQRFTEEGKDRVTASVLGVQEVAAAVTASTLTTVAVFFPITFVEGVAGQLFGDLALAVVSSLLASLAVALFAVPTMAARGGMSDGVEAEGFFAALLQGEGFVTALKRLAVQPVREGYAESAAWAREKLWRRAMFPYLWARALFLLGAGLGLYTALLGSAWVSRIVVWVAGQVLRPLAAGAMLAANAFQSVYGRVENRYSRVLGRALNGRFGVLFAAALVFVLSLGGARILGSELIPEVHQGRFTVEAAMPVGTPLGRTEKVLRMAEEIVRQHPEVASVYTQIGADNRADAGADEGEHSGRLRVQLVSSGRIAEQEARVMEDLRIALADLPKLQVKMARPALFSFATPVEVVVFGWDLKRLREAGDKVTDRIAAVDGMRDVRSSLVRGHPEILVRYDRDRLQRFNLDPATVAARVRDKIQGVTATQIRRGDRRIDLKVQLDVRDRASLADLQQININPNLIPPIPLAAVASVEEVEGPSEIRRVDQQRAVVITANLAGFDLGSASSLIADAMRGADLGDDFTWRMAGQSTEMQDSLSSLRFALLLAVFLVYVIMASTFESLLHPFIILGSVPLALVGVVAALLPLGMPISVVVFIGMIVLAGVVVNNAIVLVDTVNRRIVEGMDVDEALRVGAAMRLRPILITTATTVLGLLPLSLGLGAGSEIQQPLALTVIGGLLSSTLLTLLVIPAAYGALHSLRTRVVPVADEPAEVAT